MKFLERATKRIIWVDIYKGTVILFVVIGHSTGLFNSFIYQFHMAAFFFISGFTANMETKSVVKTIYDKFWSLLLPFFSVFFLFLPCIWMLNKIGFYQVLFKDPFIGVKRTISIFFNTGDNYVLLMGAGWFILTLFGIYVLQKLLYTIYGNKISMGYIISSILLFFFGYYLIKIGFIPQWTIFDFDLVFVGQMYFCLGLLAKKSDVFVKLSANKKLEKFFFVSSILLLWYFGKIHPATVDYPSRQFGNPFIDLLAATNGIIFCYFLSIGIERFSKGIKNIMIYLGKNTLAIVYFHFMFFKIAFYGFYLSGIVPFNYLQNFTPTTEIGNIYWPIITLVSVLCSLFLWKMLKMLPPLAIFLGESKKYSEAIWNRIFQSYWISRLTWVKDIFRNKKMSLRWKDYWRKIYTEVIDHKYLSFSIGVLLVLVCIPLAYPRIMCNDELQYRFWSLQGLKPFFSTMFTQKAGEGRAISSFFVSSATYVAFLGINSGLFRIIPTCTIIVNIFLFGYFLFKIFKNKFFSIFVSISILVFLPITFEPTSPNAFTAMYNIPFIFLLLSLIFYIDYLETNSHKKMALSIVLFFVSMLYFEIFVTYIILFFLLVIYKIPKEQRKLKNLIHKWIPLFATVVGYLLLYLLFRKVFPSNYEGNQIGGFTISSSLAIIHQLFNASFPGYFIFNKKYQYIVGMLWQNKTIFQIVSLRAILATFLFGSVCWFLLKKNKNSFETKGLKYYLIVILGGVCCIIFPTLPLAISKMYQGNVNDVNGFIALPVTYFTYFAAVFVVCYILWIISIVFKIKHFVFSLTGLIALYCFPIQCTNDAIINQQLYDYQRLEKIELLLKTDSFRSLDHHRIYAPDIYMQRNALAIHNGYWTQYAQFKGMDIELSSKDTGQEFYLAFPDDKYFIITDGNKLLLLSQENLEGKTIPVKIGKNEFYIEQVLTGNRYDNGFYLYSFVISQSDFFIENPLIISTKHD